MRIQVDATTLLLRSAGVKNYLFYWLASLAQKAAAEGDLIKTFPPGLEARGSIDHMRSLLGPRSSRWRLDLVQFTNIRYNPAINLFLIGSDVFHCSQHSANLPWRKAATATLFDMSCWTAPQFHTPQNVIATLRYGEHILKRSDGIIAISNHAQQAAVEILGIPAERIRVIYPGVPEVYFNVTADHAAEVRSKYKIELPYVLFVGCIEPRKNVGGLLRAWKDLPDRLRRDVNLILAGPFGWESEDMRARIVRGESGVRYLGYVSEPDLPGLFAGAAAFVYPSMYEGFGLPVAQAMAAGVPVVTSDRSCLPEIVAAGGICVDPSSTIDLTTAIHDVLTNADLASTLAARGRVRAATFRWLASATQSLEFFHSIAGK